MNNYIVRSYRYVIIVTNTALSKQCSVTKSEVLSDISNYFELNEPRYYKINMIMKVIVIFYIV